MKRPTSPQAVLFALLVASWVAIPPHAAALATAVVCFYNAETSIDNLESLKDEFDTYLSERGQYEFNPSGDAGTFESCVDGPAPGVYLVSAWHFRNLMETRAVDPVLVGVAHNRTARKMVLCAKKDVTSVDQLTGSIASAGSKEFTAAMLVQMVGPGGGDALVSARMLIVPKDIDALMAVGYGMAEAAFTTEASLDLLERINPRLAGELVPLLRSSDILLPIVAVDRGSDEAEALLNVLEGMSDRPEGEKRLKLLGLDGWQRLDDSERRSLEP